MSQDDSQIEQLKKKLFSNSGEELPPQGRSRLHKHNVIVGESWEEDPIQQNPVVTAKEVVKVVRRQESEDEKQGSFLKRVLLVSVLALLLALGFAWFTFSTGINDISSGNIDVRLLGPVSAPSGDVLSLDIDITNNNSADLELADLVLVYPPGTRSAIDQSSSMLADRIPIGTLKAGATTRQNIKAILFGEENVRKDIQISIEYRLQGSDSIFVKDKTYPIYIGSAPITVNVDTVKEVIPEQENEFAVTIKSNSASIIKDLVLKVEYPFGFVFLSSTPSASVGDGIWVLGDVKPEEERRIVIKGRLMGGANEQRVFNFYTGTANPQDKNSIGTVFVTNAVPIAMKRPFLGVDLALDGQTASSYIAKAGEPIKGEIVFQNNLDVPLQDIVIEAELVGAMVDKARVKGDSAFYDSLHNTIRWDSSTLTELARITPRDAGRIQFGFATLPPTTSSNSLFQRQEMNLNITVRAKRLNERNVPEEIASTIRRSVKVSSSLTLSPRITKSIGPFNNVGPIPPMPEKETTYTVMVSVGNSYNTVNNAVFSAVLPTYVKWLATTYPNNNGVSYNAQTRTVSWNLGDISAGTGFASSPKDFAFQISVTPSISQAGSSPILIKEPRISGKDSFTGQIIQTTYDSLDTKMQSDPTYKFGDDKVGGK